MVAGPEIARLVTEFEEDFDENGTILDVTHPDHHHEQTKSVQKKFVHDVQSLVTTIEQMGNPFMEDSMDLLNLNSKAVMPEKVVKSLKNMYSLGKERYYQFMEERLKSNLRSIGDTIPRNNFAMFSKPGTEKTKVAGRLTELKNDRALFSRLYIASQTREGDVDEFFRHENQSTPPSLAIGGQMRQGDKHNLLDCLEGTDMILLWMLMVKSSMDLL